MTEKERLYRKKHAASYYQRNKALYRERYHEKNVAYNRERRKKLGKEGDRLSVLAAINSCRARAKKLNLPFDLNAAYLESITPTHCPVLGIPLKRNRGKNGPAPNSPSIDRIIPTDGYVRGNVVIVSFLANTIRNVATPEQIQAVASFYQLLLNEHNSKK